MVRETKKQRNEAKAKENTVVDKDSQVVDLPITKFGLNDYFNTIIGAYGLPDNDDTRTAIATVVFHAPADAGSLTLGYVGHRVRKAMANYAAYEILEEIKAKKKAQQADTNTQVPVNVIPIKD